MTNDSPQEAFHFRHADGYDPHNTGERSEKSD